jgi:hypothetical protein
MANLQSHWPKKMHGFFSVLDNANLYNGTIIEVNMVAIVHA